MKKKTTMYKVQVMNKGSHWAIRYKTDGTRGRYQDVARSYTRKYDAVRGAKRVLKTTSLNIEYV